MEVHRSMSDIITDVSQAHELGDNILRDLRFAHPTASAEIPFHPLVQVGDIVEIDNPRLGTSAENDIFKVVTVQTQYSKDRKRTSLTLIGHDKFISAPAIKTNPPTGLGFEMQKRVIQNYPNSGWTGYEKETYFPMITWTPPTKDVEGNTLPDDFGGYVIERGTQINRDRTLVSSTWRYGTIASVPSYITSLGLKVNYFYDYSCADTVNAYLQLGNTDGYVDFRYRIYAINRQGEKSAVSSTVTVRVQVPATKDAEGNYHI
jgi:hypothetical protein